MQYLSIRLLIIVTIFICLACTGKDAVISPNEKIMTVSYNVVSASPETENPEEVAVVIPNLPFPAKIQKLREELICRGVPGEWFDEQLREKTFRMHSKINNYFRNSAEKQVDREKKYDISWYFARLAVKEKIEKGREFLQTYSNIFQRVEAKNGIHRELIAAILGIETNFAEKHQSGQFYAFNSLVSQYVFTGRKKFAVREITALYKFSQKTARSPQYFTSSYAGAIGWGQFIPSSLLDFFIDSNDICEDSDPFSLEDTIFSIENYLNKHNLSGKNIRDYKARYKAVYAYNHSDAYVQAVLFIYEGLRNYSLIEQSRIPAK